MPKHVRDALIRGHLLALRDELRARHSRIQRDLRRETDALVADAPDRAIQQGNDETLVEIDEATTTEMAAIEAALGRLDSGDYGICSHCHLPIDSRRLTALPQAVLCASCALAKSATSQ